MVTSPDPSCPGQPLVDLSGATKLYGPTVAIWRVDLWVFRGDAVGIVGGNGSGKTTLLRVVAGVLDLDAGLRRVADESPRAHPRIALLGHRTGLYGDLSLRENLRLVALASHSRAGWRDEVLAQLDLHEVADLRVSTLSAGTRRRAGLARALVSDPDLLIADEPFSSVDARHAEAMADAMRSWHASGGSLIVAGHDAATLLPVCVRLHRLSGGRLVSAVDSAAHTGRCSA